jgi:cyclopropane fatty-acyl-phospholipid synthase-like methyltransferase
VDEVFNRTMTMFSQMLGPAALAAYDFSYLNGKTLVDVGGGHGHLLTMILKRYPQIRGTIFDLEHVHTGAKGRISEAGLVNRCEATGGDFFTASRGRCLHHEEHHSRLER